ncbi:MAG TPA: hypothetical protein ENN49_00055 [Bacteroidales bacterium]|nr:hypothetical protein [Bacteroidales bacterium]
MDSLSSKIALVTLFISIYCISHAQTDSAGVNLYLLGQSFFDNKEFTGNIKKGYTHPGFYIQPAIKFETKQYSIAAGFHTLYLAGADTLEQFVPVFSARLLLNSRIMLNVGTLESLIGHWLPEPLFKPERLFLNQPETGVQFLYQGIWSKADLWINWERYIKTGSPFQEEFTVGFTHLYNLNDTPGFSNAFHAMASHHGGQIDSTNLPVQTHANIGLLPAFRFKPYGNTTLALATSVYYYKNLSPSFTSEYNTGFGLHPQVKAYRNYTTLEVGFWYSHGFVNPRGEELFGSVSTINPIYNQSVRQLGTVAIEYQKRFMSSMLLNANFKAYYDFKSNLLEYSYTLRLMFDGKLKRVM